METILVLVLALGIFYWISHKSYFLLAAAIIGGIGLFIPILAQKIHWAWMKLSHAMGYVMSKLLLSIIFFVFLVPISFLSRAFGRHNVQLKSGGKSYFKERNYTYTKDSLENVW